MNDLTLKKLILIKHLNLNYRILDNVLWIYYNTTDYKIEHYKDIIPTNLYKKIIESNRNFIEFDDIIIESEIIPVKFKFDEIFITLDDFTFITKNNDTKVYQILNDVEREIVKNRIASKVVDNEMLPSISPIVNKSIDRFHLINKVISELDLMEKVGEIEVRLGFSQWSERKDFIVLYSILSKKLKSEQTFSGDGIDEIIKMENFTNTYYIYKDLYKHLN